MSFEKSRTNSNRNCHSVGTSSEQYLPECRKCVRPPERSTLHTLEEYVPQGYVPIWLYPVAYGSSADKLFHNHQFTEIAIITEGEVDHIIDNESYHLRKGDVICLHPGVTHGYNGCAHMAMINLLYDIPRLALPCFDAYDLNKFHVFFPSLNEKEDYHPLTPILHLNDSDFQEVMEIINALSREINGNTFGKGMMTLSHFINLVITLSRLMQPSNFTVKSNFPERLSFAIDYINSHFTENLSTDKLAQLACTSKRTLFRIFKQKTGMKISDYVRKLRLQKAYTLLLCTNDPVQKIAWQCGFSSDNRFCKVFHAINNCTPLEFRRHVRKKNPPTDEVPEETP